MRTLAYKPHEYYSYLRTINHSDIGVMCTNLANYGGPTLYDNSVPLNPMVLLIIIPIKWLFHWEY